MTTIEELLNLATEHEDGSWRRMLLHKAATELSTLTEENARLVKERDELKGDKAMWEGACAAARYERDKLQSQLTAAHLENGRLREAVKASKAVLMKSAVTVLDSCTCDGCNTIRLIDQALTPTTPNPILQDLNELQQESDALAKWGDAHGQKGEHSVWETLDNMVERLKELERDKEGE